MSSGHSAIHIGEPSPRSSSEFEDLGASTYHARHQQEADLPLYHMQEDITRRRVPRGNGARSDVDHDQSELEPLNKGGYDDEKHAYAKMNTPKSTGMGGGRVRRGPLPPPSNLREFFEQNIEHIAPVIYTLLSCWTRFYRIGKADNVVWDEAHFGKFGGYYIKREFYFDVHPPLGKMLVGLAGFLSGFDGRFEFKSGEKYPDDVPYVAMRVLLACFGVAMVPLGWYTAVELGMSWRACHMVAVMVLCDVAWLCISRFILLDSMLLFFTCLTVFCLSKFHNQQYQSFSFDWWLWLTATGLSIGCVCSIKLVGLFVTALVGVYTIEDLWTKLGDLRLSYKDQAKHWAARVACLIVLPLVVYMAAFKIHFIILNHSGPGDAQMSSLFQANLVGNTFGENPLEIAFGSKVTLKNYGYGGGLLHSHVQTYPEGSNQQQVTCYHYKDDNNNWRILPRWDEPEYSSSKPLRFLEHNDVIKLSHTSTTRNLHSHNVASFVTKNHNEVSCYGNATIGDNHDYWVVEVVDDLKQGRRENVKRIHALTTRLRFRHQVLGCYLRAASATLPQWGFKQTEVTCDKEDDPDDVHTYWNVESHYNERLPPGEARFYRSPFLHDFWHLNVAMMNSNNALVPDPDKEDVLASKPLDWPFLHLGLRMCGWGDGQTKFYLLGTPVIYFGGGISLIVSLLALGVYLFRWQRKYQDMNSEEWGHFLYVGKIAFLGWFFHYFPFLVMGRVTYVHHYLPTLYFAVLMFGHIVDHFVLTSRILSERTKWITYGVLMFSIVANFWWFRGMALGIDGPIKDYWGVHWRKSWNIYDL